MKVIRKFTYVVVEQFETFSLPKHVKHVYSMFQAWVVRCSLYSNLGRA